MKYPGQYPLQAADKDAATGGNASEEKPKAARGTVQVRPAATRSPGNACPALH